jgi:quinol-cytochrome oxidoreductase complex cytochrome b subunit
MHIMVFWRMKREAVDGREYYYRQQCKDRIMAGGFVLCMLMAVCVCVGIMIFALLYSLEFQWC